MALSTTHKYRLEVGSQVFKGNVEINAIGVLAYEQDGTPYMPEQTRHIVENIINALGGLAPIYGNIDLFKLEKV